MGPNFFDLKLTQLAHLLSFASLFCQKNFKRAGVRADE